MATKKKTVTKKTKVASSATRRRGGKKTVKKIVKKVVKTKVPKTNKARSGKKKELLSAAPEKCFWVWNGPILSNLFDLQQALNKDISDIQFEYHCSDGECDFALWVNEVLCDSACARALAKAKNKKEAVKAVTSCLKKYYKGVKT